jgi:hypothetical protein
MLLKSLLELQRLGRFGCGVASVHMVQVQTNGVTEEKLLSR